MRDFEKRELTIEAGETASNIVDRTGYPYAGAQFPPAMTSTVINIEVSNSSDPSTFKQVTDYASQDVNGKKSSIPFGASENFQLWVECAGFRFVRFVGDSAEAAARVFTLYMGD